LTYAGMRHKLMPVTHGCIMVKISYNGRLVECETADEAIEILRHIKRETKYSGASHGTIIHEVWNNRVFWKFIEKLGENQKQVLQALLKRGKLTDAELRNLLHLESNKQLAGVLSGISKQAAAHDIPARAVYQIENESKSGKVTKSYAAAHEFSWIAVENNWEE